MTDAQKEFFEHVDSSGGHYTEIDSELGFSSMELGSWENRISSVSFYRSFFLNQVRCKTNELISLFDYFYGPSELLDLPAKANPEQG